MWTQVETGSAITWKYPSCILRGNESQGEFYSIAIANNAQQADTGTKMIHLGKNTKSRIVSKGISAGRAQNTYRGLVSMHPKATNSRNYTQCDSPVSYTHLDVYKRQIWSSCSSSCAAPDWLRRCGARAAAIVWRKAPTRSGFPR